MITPGTFLLVRIACRAVCGVVVASRSNVTVRKDPTAISDARTCQSLVAMKINPPQLTIRYGRSLQVPSGRRYLLVRIACRAVCKVVVASKSNVTVRKDPTATNDAGTCQRLVGMNINPPQLTIRYGRSLQVPSGRRYLLVRIACRAVCGVVVASKSNVAVRKDPTATNDAGTCQRLVDMKIYPPQLTIRDG
jgi:hypothetical protein